MNLTISNTGRNKNINFGNNNFEITNLDGIHCAYCGNEMISGKGLNRIFPAKTKQHCLYLDKARENAQLLNSFRTQILNFLTQVQYEYDFNNDSCILSKAASLSNKEVLEDIFQRTEEIETLVDRLGNKWLKNLFSRKKPLFIEYILKKKRYCNFLNFIYGKSWLGMNPHHKKGVSLYINRLAEDIKSTSEYSIFEYIGYKHKKKFSPSEFYQDLFSQSISTIDHVSPSSKGGIDDISNFLAVCRKCNSIKGNLSLLEYFHLHPEVGENIPFHLAELKRKLPKFISDNKISKDYKDYPDTISETINQISNGEIN